MGVTGIGGLFFRARDPEALAAWYVEWLGVGGGCIGDPALPPGDGVWQSSGGPVVFAPFRTDSDYVAADKAFMLNLRVDNLDAVLARLRDAHVAIETRADWDDAGMGRFARVHDPEGNPIELWEPTAD